jgi:hypothetical protein
MNITDQLHEVHVFVNNLTLEVVIEVGVGEVGCRRGAGHEWGGGERAAARRLPPSSPPPPHLHHRRTAASFLLPAAVTTFYTPWTKKIRK